MELITTHTGADFDALASVVAARKLYPQAKAIIPGSPEKAVRDFLSLWQDKLYLDTERDIDFELIDKLIIVETRLASRIGKTAELLNKKGLYVEIYDHHPRTRYDITANKDIYKQTGATVTILADILRRKRVAVTPLEATVMALGIYEDTGSLTFQTTTKLDIDTVGYLFSQGVSLSTVSSYLKRELSQQQLAFLSEMINRTKDYIISGLHVGIVAIESRSYIEDFALLVHKLIDIENFNLLFAFIKSDSKIQMIARSNIAYVNVDNIAKAFGGGGHLYAASAIIKDANIEGVIEKLLELLKSKLRPKIFAKDIIPASVKTVYISASVAEVEKLMKDFNLDGIAVLDRDRIAGIANIQDIKRAIKRGYGHSSIKGYMKTAFTKVSSRTPLYKIQHIIHKDKIGHIAVSKNKRFIGLIGRCDVARIIHKDLLEKEGILRPRRKVTPAIKNISSKIKKSLPSQIYRILEIAGRLADRKGYQAFCVGGFVRDIILGVRNFDVDIVLEQNGLAFARKLADILKGSLVVHKRFGTATIVTRWLPAEKRGPDSRTERFKIDIATARTEYYEYPAALPKVSFSSIKQDLYRRDFTINAIAVSINKGTFGRLIDFFNGQNDLRARKVRILHDLSFVEDPTRIFRAVRFEQRYNFTIEPHTEDLIKTAVNLDMFGRTQKQRLRDELILILSEANPEKALVRMHELHELRFIHPKLKLTKRLLTTFDDINEALSWYRLSFLTRRAIDAWIIYFMAMMNDISLSQVKLLCEKFVFTKGDQRRIISCRRYAKRIANILERRQKLLPSQIYKCLEPLSYEVILYIMAIAKGQMAKERVSLFFRKYNGIKLIISGRDLKLLGIRPGPRYKRLLDKILYEKIDGKIKSKEDELRLAKNLSNYFE